MSEGYAGRAPYWLHRRQYVIGPKPWKVRPDWETVLLGDGLVLSHCPELPVARATDREGEVWTLIGLAIQADPDRPSPEVDIAACPTAEIPRRADSWAGSWLLIGDGVLYPDATSSTPCCYRRFGSGKDDVACWLSSSLALLGDISDAGDPPTAIGFPGPETFYCIPPPLTSFEGVYRLLPTQMFSLMSGNASPRPMIFDEPGKVPYSECIGRLEGYLQTVLRNAAAPAGALWLSLTAGRDTRLLLAAAVAVGVTCRTFTQHYRFMPDSDRELPPRLAAAAGIAHEAVRPRAANQSRARLFDRHCAHQAFGQVRTFFAHDQWRFCGPRDVITRGDGVEIGRDFFFKRFPPGDPPERPADDANLYARLVRSEAPHMRRAFEAWTDCARAAPISNLDWRTRFYMEVSMGSWTSGREQAMDLGCPPRLMPVNAACIYRAMLAIPEELRAQARHQDDLIARWCPALADFPYNPEDSWRRSRLKYAAGFVWWTRRHGARAGAAKLIGYLRNGPSLSSRRRLRT